VDFTVPRKSQRVCIQRPVTVRYNRDGYFEFTGISRDLSDSGIFLFTESVIEVGAQVELTLTFPSETAQPIPVRVEAESLGWRKFPRRGSQWSLTR
jgi:hypothetical protein